MEPCPTSVPRGSMRGMKIAGRVSLVAAVASLLVFGGLAHSSVPAAEGARTVCGTWTPSGSIRNDTGQAVYLQDSDGRLPRQVVPAGVSVPFTDTLPASVRKHADTMTVTSLDYTGGVHPVAGWRFTEDEWMYRPADCRP